MIRGIFVQKDYILEKIWDRLDSQILYYLICSHPIFHKRKGCFYKKIIVVFLSKCGLKLIEG